MSKVIEEDPPVETALFLWGLQKTTENIESVVSAVKNMYYFFCPVKASFLSFLFKYIM